MALEWTTPTKRLERRTYIYIGAAFILFLESLLLSQVGSCPNLKEKEQQYNSWYQLYWLQWVYMLKCQNSKQDLWHNGLGIS